MRLSPFLLFLSSLLLLLLLLVVPSALSASLPAVPSEYQTTVEFNFGTLGYTLSYDEAYSASLGLLRTDGRYDGRGMIEFTSFTGRNVVMKAINSSASSGSQCTGYYLTAAQNASLLFAPTYALWQLMNYSGFSWTNLGQDQIGDRETNSTHYQSGVYSLSSSDIFCDASGNCDATGGVYPTPPWDLLEMVDFSHSYDSSSYTVSFQLDVYLDVVMNGAVGIPMRIEVSGTRVNNTSGSNLAVPFNNTYDFANFRRLDRTTLTSLRRTYQSCQPTSANVAYRPSFPAYSTVSTTAIAIGTAPPLSSFPNEFTMVVESPITGMANGGVAGGPNGPTNQNWAVRYTLDETNMRESTQSQLPWSTSITINIWQYGDGSAYPQSGQVWRVGETWSQNGPGNVTCTTANLTNWGPNANSNRLRQSLAMTVGSFADFFLAASSFDATSLGYAGKGYARSVNADVYTGTFTGQSGFGNLSVSWTTSVYLFPAGWQYPGRTSATDLQLPFLIINAGTATNTYSGTSFSFRLTYNIFSLEPQTDPNFFTDLPAAYNCPMTVTQQNGGSAPTPPVRTVNPPYVSPEYSATVEINFGTLGYTLSYDEYYSQSNQMLRADGRYDSRAITEITNFGSSPVTMNSYNILDGTCSTYSLTSAQNASLLYSPSFAILQLMNYSGLQWLQRGNGGQQFNIPQMIQDRNIPATNYYIQSLTILPSGTFCDANGNCNDANGDITAVPPYSFLELLDFATSPEADTEDGITDEPTYTTVLSLNYFVQTMTRGGMTGAIPLRVELNGTRYMTGVSGSGQSFYNIYDWTNWRPLDTTAFSTVTSSSSYSTCVSAGSSYRAPFPNATAVETSNITVGSAPSASSFPSQFVMQVEGLIAEFNLRQQTPGNGGPNGGGGGTGPNLGNAANITGTAPINYAAKWSYDSVGNQESVSTYADNYTLATYPTIYIYEYGSSYANSGEVWQVDGSQGSYTCVDATLSDSDENPLQSERGGVISFTKLFTSSSYDLSNFQYVGRSLQRGVSADWYRASFTNVLSTDTSYYGALSFTYTANIYMYPLGWSFPGRANAGDLQLPLRVTFQGRQTNLTSGVNTTFLDAYNIFEFFPASDIMAASTSTGLVSSSWFPDSPSTYGCPAYVASSSSSSSSSSNLSGGAIAGIVIAVLVAVAVVVVMIFVCKSRRGLSTKGKMYGSDDVKVVTGNGFKKHSDEAADEPSVSRTTVTSEQELSTV